MSEYVEWEDRECEKCENAMSTYCKKCGNGEGFCAFCDCDEEACTYRNET